MNLNSLKGLVLILLFSAGLSGALLAQGVQNGHEPTKQDAQRLIAIERDIVYGYGSCLNVYGIPYQIPLKLDAYYPVQNHDPNKPAVLLIHGGLWGWGPPIKHDKRAEHLVMAAYYFAARGIVCFSLNYRDLTSNPDADGLNDWLKAQRASFVDAKAAIRWIRAHAEDYGIDPEAIAAYGGSSGGGTSLMLAISDSEDFSTDYPGGEIPATNYPDEDPRVQASFDFWGTCFEVELGNPPEVRFFDFSDEFSADDAPIQIFHGTEDKMIPFTHAEAIAQKCVDYGIYHELVALEGEGHGVWHASVDRVPLNELALNFLFYDLGWNVSLEP